MLLRSTMKTVNSFVRIVLRSMLRLELVIECTGITNAIDCRITAIDHVLLLL